MKIPHLVLFLLIAQFAFGQEFEWIQLQKLTGASLRGLSVVNDEVVWASGSQGTVLRSIDGGKTWEKCSPLGFEALDFRSLYSFNAEEAIIANAGSPAYILTTSDGGRHWRLTYSNNHPDAFVDGLDFWNSRTGMLYGDPIDGRMFLLHTQDGGVTWTPATASPALEKGEASFAASGTGIRCFEQNEAMICTGGTVSRLWLSSDRGKTWRFLQPPVIMGKPSAGIFSAVRWDHSKITVVGGDFQETTQVNHFLSVDAGKTWQVPAQPVRGYRECVEFLGGKTLVAVGPAGSDISVDGGLTWNALVAPDGIHVVRKARAGQKTFAAGSGGLLLQLIVR